MPYRERLQNAQSVKYMEGGVPLLILLVALTILMVACGRSTAEGPQVPPTMPVKVQRIGSQEIGNT